jgi:hypothetical protein
MVRSPSLSETHPDQGATPPDSVMAFGLRLAALVVTSAARLGHLADRIPGRRLDGSFGATAPLPPPDSLARPNNEYTRNTPLWCC